MELNSDDTPRGSKPGMSGGGDAEMGTGRVGRGGLRRGEWHGEGRTRTGGATLKRAISFQDEVVMGGREGRKGQKEVHSTPLLRTYPSFFGRYSSEKRLDLEGGGGGGGGAVNDDSRGWFVKFILSRGCVMSILIYCLLRFSVCTRPINPHSPSSQSHQNHTAFSPPGHALNNQSLMKTVYSPKKIKKSFSPASPSTCAFVGY